MTSKNEGSTRGNNTKTTLGLVLAHVFSGVIVYIIVEAALKFEHATDALAFYGVYHRQPWNQVIHFFGVPGILWTILIFLVHLQIPIFGVPRFTYGLLLTLFYVVFYLQMDPLGGTLYAPFLYLMYKSAVYLTDQDRKTAAAGNNQSWCGTGRLLIFAFIVHVFSWYVQIHLGHHIIEGAQPASLQSLGGAVTVAPLFAFYEGLWWLGINKELQNTTMQLVDKYTYELCEPAKPYPYHDDSFPIGCIIGGGSSKKSLRTYS
jgi:uncharacterized membrane protein YGL010W